ncbi:hypothetical protein ACJX0J_039687, partial [Zea mays]
AAASISVSAKFVFAHAKSMHDCLWILIVIGFWVVGLRLLNYLSQQAVINGDIIVTIADNNIHTQQIFIFFWENINTLENKVAKLALEHIIHVDNATQKKTIINIEKMNVRILLMEDLTKIFFEKLKWKKGTEKREHNTLRAKPIKKIITHCTKGLCQKASKFGKPNFDKNRKTPNLVLFLEFIN